MSNKRFKELVWFSISGVVGYIVDTIITVLLVSLLGVYLARIPGFVGASTSTWLINRSFTFKYRKSTYNNLFKEYAHYVGLMLGGLVVNYLTYIILLLVLPDNDFRIYIAIAAGCLAGMLVNYLSSRRYIFTGKPKQDKGN